MIPVLHGVWSAGGVVGDYEHIETITVGAGGAASVTFSSIPGTYKHLQVRGLVTFGPPNAIFARLNSDTGSNYTFHQLYGTGSIAGSSAETSRTSLSISKTVAASGQVGSFVADFLDYVSTSKNKTMRSLTGYDSNGGGLLGLHSGVWMNSSNAVTSITLLGDSSNLGQYTSFSLYGVK